MCLTVEQFMALQQLANDARALAEYELSDYRRQYYEENWDRISQKFKCECGGKYTFGNKARHSYTVRHRSYMIKRGLNPQIIFERHNKAKALAAAEQAKKDSEFLHEMRALEKKQPPLPPYPYPSHMLKK
jgi:hypothetical protein